jgi:PhzF family phenazine biosynthesis protein
MPVIIEIDVFTSMPGEGNPACVVLDTDALDDTSMQAVARKTASETAFVISAVNGKADFKMRYFSPKGEMNLCAHATLGALWALCEETGRQGELTLETQVGILRACIETVNNRPARAWLELPAPSYYYPEISPQAAAAALSIALENISGRLVAASVGRPKLMVPLSDYRILDECKPVRTELDRLCAEHNLTGLYPYTCRARNPGVDIEARQFPYNIGFVEDPVTGVAMAALGAYLVDTGQVANVEPLTRLVMEQGYAIGCPGRAEIFTGKQIDRPGPVWIAGIAVRVSKA